MCRFATQPHMAGSAKCRVLSVWICIAVLFSSGELELRKREHGRRAVQLTASLEMGNDLRGNWLRGCYSGVVLLLGAGIASCVSTINYFTRPFSRQQNLINYRHNIRDPRKHYLNHGEQ